MKILFFGDDNPDATSYHRYRALQRIGHDVEIYDPAVSFHGKTSGVLPKVHFRTGYRFVQHAVKSWVRQVITRANGVDVIWVNGGEYFGPRAVKEIKKLERPVILYNNDDPTGNRDGRRFDLLKKSISSYDVCVVMRDINVKEYYDLGAKKVISTTMSYDELIHKPFETSSKTPPGLQSEIAFIGTWMRDENRDEFLLDLIGRGLPVSIWGNRWEKSKFWHILKKNHRGSALKGRDYVRAVQSAKICIGLLSKGNRDEYTTRSFEIPYAGGLLCAERTTKHLEFYEDGEEAYFWKDAEECARICKELLNDSLSRDRVRAKGMLKVRSLGVGNEDICKRILASI